MFVQSSWVKFCLLKALICSGGTSRYTEGSTDLFSTDLESNLKSSKFSAFTLMLNLTTDFGTQLVISLERKAKNIGEDASFALDLVIKETTYICLHVSRLLRSLRRSSVMFQSFHVII